MKTPKVLSREIGQPLLSPSCFPNSFWFYHNLWLSFLGYIYMCICVCMYVYIHIDIYTMGQGINIGFRLAYINLPINIAKLTYFS